MATMVGAAAVAAMATGFALSKDTLLVEAAESGIEAILAEEGTR